MLLAKQRFSLYSETGDSPSSSRFVPYPTNASITQPILISASYPARPHSRILPTTGDRVSKTSSMVARKLTTWMSIWMWPTFLVKVPRGPVTTMVRAFEATVTPSGMTRDSTEEMSFIFF